MKDSNAGTIAVVYARYSSHSQGEQSIEGQLSAARTYAEAKGYTIIHEYIDRAISGKTDNREEFQKMLADTAKKQFKVIIVWKVDRFGRNREEITFNKYRCKKNDVRVEYVAENVPDSAEGVILESVLEGMAEYYSLQLSQNVKRGLLESAKKHHVIGGQVPLGYNMGPDKTFVIDPKTAPTVRLIFDMYAAGSTVTEVIAYLNKNGYRTKAGKPFTRNSLSVVLKNEKYIGIYEYKDIIRDEDAVPAIVDKEVFYKVQEMLKVNRRMPSHRWSYTDYLLTDKIFCGHCGAGMTGESGFGKMGVKYSYYVCAKRRKEKSCKKKPVRADWIEGLVLDQVQRLLQNDEMIEFIAENTWQCYLEQDADQEQIRILQEQLADVEKGIGNLVRSIEAGIFNDIIKSRMDELETQRTALKKALADKELTQEFKLTKDHILFFLKKFKEPNFRNRDFQKRLVDIFVNAIFVYDDHIKLVFNFSDSPKNTVTLADLDKAESGSEFVRCVLYSAQTRTSELIWFGNVFMMNIKISEEL